MESFPPEDNQAQEQVPIFPGEGQKCDLNPLAQQSEAGLQLNGPNLQDVKKRIQTRDRRKLSKKF